MFRSVFSSFLLLSVGAAHGQDATGDEYSPPLTPLVVTTDFAPQAVVAVSSVVLRSSTCRKAVAPQCGPAPPGESCSFESDSLTLPQALSSYFVIIGALPTAPTPVPQRPRAPSDRTFALDTPFVDRCRFRSEGPLQLQL